MQHINLVSAPFGRIELPAVGPDSVRPASTKIFVALSGCGARLPPGRTIAHSGRGTGFPESVLRPALPLALNSIPVVWSTPNDPSRYLEALAAFLAEHRGCGELDCGAESDVVWMMCTCGAGISQIREPQEPL